MQMPPDPALVHKEAHSFHSCHQGCRNSASAPHCLSVTQGPRSLSYVGNVYRDWPSKGAALQVWTPATSNTSQLHEGSRWSSAEDGLSHDFPTSQGHGMLFTSTRYSVLDR